MNLSDIEAAAAQLSGKIVKTPVIDVQQTGIEELLPKASRVSMKL